MVEYLEKYVIYLMASGLFTLTTFLSYDNLNVHCAALLVNICRMGYGGAWNKIVYGIAFHLKDT